MGIPIYNQQVAPPHKPRDTTAGMQAEAIGAFGEQVQQIGNAFAGRLFDLAAQNERNKAEVQARDKWRSFWSDLQRDPEYANYGKKFDKFYNDLRDEVQRGIKMPRAKREAGERFGQLKGEWGDSVQRLSDERAIDDARTIRVTAINQAVADLDVDRLMEQINESDKTMEFTEADLAKMKEAGIREIVGNKTMDYARMQGDAGMEWLLSDEAQSKFEVWLGPEEHYFLDADTRNKMAVQLSQERTNKLKAAEIADYQRKKSVMEYARDLINRRGLTSVDQLDQEDHQNNFSQKYNMQMNLNNDDREAIKTMLADRAEIVEKDREEYSNKLLNIVKDALEAGDQEMAGRYLEELVDGGYAVDAMGRLDPDVRRYMEQLGKVRAGEGLTEFDKDANAMRAKLRAGTLNRKDLADFLGRHPDKEGRLEHDKMWNELQQQEREAEEKASKQGAESEELLLADYVEYFHRIYGAKNVTVDELVKLDQWRYKNYPRNERDRNLAGIPENDFANWGKLIASKIEDLEKQAGGMRTKMKGLGENRIKEYWDTQLKPLEGARRPRQLQELAEKQNQRDRMVLDYLEAVKDEKLNPVDVAQGLINAAAKIEVDSLYGPQYKAPAVELPSAGGDMVREYAVEPTARVRQPVADTPELAAAKRTMLQFARYAKDANGLIIRRNKKSGELSLYDNNTKQWVKVDEARLSEYASAAGMVQKYE